MRVHTLTSACSLSVFCSVIGVLPSPMYNTLYQQQALWNNLLAHFKSRDVLVEGPIDALRPYLMNLSKPRPLKKKVRRAQPAHTGEPAHDYCVHACVCMRVCVGRQADTDRHRHTHTDTDRHRHTHTHAHTRTFSLNLSFSHVKRPCFVFLLSVLCCCSLSLFDLCCSFETPALCSPRSDDHHVHDEL